MTRLGGSYAYCERLTRRAAGNFYPAMQVLPRAQRRAMYALYAFNRLTDDLADDEGTPADKERALHAWRESLFAALAGDDPHPAFPALRHAVRSFEIPPMHLHAVIDGCLLDVVPHRYQTFAELYRYCTLVASSVGQACIHIWGFRGESAPQHAEAAGVALQLTNILRDLGEDRDRGRIYLPREELDRFGCSPGRICDEVSEPSFRDLMRFQVSRAREYYSAARMLDGCLRPSGRAVYRVMLDTYRSLLDRIEASEYDVFARRIRLTKWEKLALVARAMPLRWGWRRA